MKTGMRYGKYYKIYIFLKDEAPSFSDLCRFHRYFWGLPAAPRGINPSGHFSRKM